MVAVRADLVGVDGGESATRLVEFHRFVVPRTLLKGALNRPDF